MQYDESQRQMLKETEAVMAKLIAEYELKMKENDEAGSWRFPAWYWKWRAKRAIKVLERNLLDFRGKWKTWGQRVMPPTQDARGGGIVTCSTCKWYHPFGLCKRHAPTPGGPMDSSLNPKLYPCFPWMHEDDYCGDWEEKAATQHKEGSSE